ncbi:hypothetical protein BH23CHL8_BH23CHL8_29180 [soil metagenome]
MSRERSRDRVPLHQSDPGEASSDARAEQDALLRAMTLYLADTFLAPPDGLSSRVLARIEQEPRSGTPRGFVAAVLALDGRAARSGFLETVRTAVDKRAPKMMRAEALAIILLTMLTVGAVGAAGAATVGTVLQGLTGPSSRETTPPSPMPEMGTPKASPLIDMLAGDRGRPEAIGRQERRGTSSGPAREASSSKPSRVTGHEPLGAPPSRAGTPRTRYSRPPAGRWEGPRLRQARRRDARRQEARGREAGRQGGRGCRARFASDEGTRSRRGRAPEGDAMSGGSVERAAHSRAGVLVELVERLDDALGATAGHRSLEAIRAGHEVPLEGGGAWCAGFRGAGHA